MLTDQIALDACGVSWLRGNQRESGDSVFQDMFQGHPCSRHGPRQARGRGFTGFAALLIAAFMVTVPSGCHYTGGFQDYVQNGFKVGPNYCRPAAPVADEWIDEYDERVWTELPNHADWWSVFDDPALNNLMEGAYQQNLSLREAGLRVLQARYQRAIAVGSLLPQFQEGYWDYSHTQQSLITLPTKNLLAAGVPVSRTIDLNALGFNLAWELDVFGRFRRNIEAADATLDATIEDYDAVLVSLLSETATAYVELRAAQQRLRYARENAKIQQGSLELAENRRKEGDVSELDPSQAKNSLYNTRQQIPVFENQVRLANNRLCVLLGIPPRDLTAELGEAPTPKAPAGVVVGMPANLLRRRPDVRTAERQVAAQSARIGVAVTDLLPRISINGTIKVEAENFGDLFTSNSAAGVINPGLTWDILNYGRLINNIDLQNARFQELAVAYQQKVLQANAEVEDAIHSFLKSQERLVEVRQAVEAAKRSLELGTIQYREGEIDFNRVFNLQEALVTDQDTLATVEGDVARSLVAVYRALGGGWEIRYGIRVGTVAESDIDAEGTEPGVGEAEEIMLPPLPDDEV